MTALALAVALDLVLVVTGVALGGALAVHAVLAVLPAPAALLGDACLLECRPARGWPSPGPTAR